MKQKLPLIVLLVCAALFVGGLVQLFRLRFEAGDIYPAYSSLRTDPLGTRAFYESLERIPGFSVRRDYSRSNRLPEAKQTCYLHLAASVHDWRTVPEEIFREVEAFTIRGGRLVITLVPETRDPIKSRLGDRMKNEAPGTSGPDGPSARKRSEPDKPAKQQRVQPSEGPGPSRRVSLRERWGVEFAFLQLEQRRDGTYESVVARNEAIEGPTGSLSWHSGVVFTNLAPTWRVIYARDEHPVVIERKFGSGTVVFATDSYFLSNQALREERHADWLARLVGPSQQIVFDEAHLGVREDPGVVTLIRKYHLHPVIAALVLLAGLFIWKNSVSFVPADPDETPTAEVLGKESAAGFVNLLRRNIPAREVLNVCVAEWQKSFAHGASVSPGKLERLQAVIAAENALPPRAQNPIKAYQTISRILNEY